MKTRLLIAAFASFASSALFAAGPGGSFPGGNMGEMPVGGSFGGETAGGGSFGGAFSYDSVVTALTTNSDWSVSRDGTIVGYTASAVKCNPSSGATAFVDGAYARNGSITAVDLSSSSITEIPADCFAGCTSLKEVVLPSTVTKIGSGAFAGCTALECAVGGGLKEIGDDAFRDCIAMTTAPLTNSASVGTCAFANCPSLASFAASASSDSSGSSSDSSSTSDSSSGTSSDSSGSTDTSDSTDSTDASGSSGSSDSSDSSDSSVVTDSGLWPEDGEYDSSSARVYNGWIADSDGSLVGTIQVKAGKMSSRSSTFKASAMVKDANGKTWRYAKGTGDGEGVVSSLTCTKSGAAVSSFGVRLYENGMSGDWGAYSILGARNGMAVKGDAMCESLENDYQTSWTVAYTNDLGYTRLRLVVGNGGKVKITGYMAPDLTVRAKVQSVMGDGALYVPCLATVKKSGNVHYANMLLKLNADGTAESQYASFGGLAAGGHTTADLGEVSYVGSDVSVGGESFSATVSVDDLAYPVKFTAKNLPGGLKIDSSTGEIYGTPTKPGVYTATVTVKSALDSKSCATLSVPITVANYADGLIPVADSYGGMRVGVKTCIELAGAADGCRVSGLPAGLKFAASATVDKVYGLGDIPAYTIYGVPKKPATNTVYFTKTVGNVKHTASATFIVDGIHDWALGAFQGAVADGSGNAVGLIDSEVVKAGKMSGKLFLDGDTWKISSPAYDSYDSESGSYTASVAAESGNLAFTYEVTVRAGAVDGSVRGVVTDGNGEWFAWQSLWKTDPWKTVAKSFAGKKLVIAPDDGSAITLKFASSGAVTAAGKFVYENLRTSKSATYSATSSSTLIPGGEDAYSVFVYFPPKTTSTMAFEGYAAEILLNWTGDSFELAEE